MPIYEAEFLGEAKPIRAPKEKKGKKPSIEKTTDAALIPSDAPYGLNKKGKSLSCEEYDYKCSDLLILY